MYGEPEVMARAAAFPEPLFGHRDESCTLCGGCARHCAARAIRMGAEGSEIILDRCVACGACVYECGKSGFLVRDDLPRVREFLASGRPIVAVLASEHVAAMYPSTPAEVERALESLGFDAVETTVLGEELVAAAYEVAHARTDATLPRLRSTCPVAVNWVRRYYPQLVGALVPVVPPYVAQARLVKALYPPNTVVVYVSPCWARKDEVYQAQIADAVDVAIGFDELKALLAEQPAPLASVPASVSVSARRPHAAKELSLTDGFPRRTLSERDMTDRDVVSVRGLVELDRLLAGIVAGEVAPSVVDMLNCEGCIDGPTVNRNLSVFAKRNLIAVARHREPPPVVDSRSFLGALPSIELRRSFISQPVLARVATSDEIDTVLAAGEFANRDEVIDCGACGHDTCVEMAAAISVGDSSWEHCFPLQRKLMQRAGQRLFEHALTDELTGLGNRRAFDARLLEEVARVKRHHGALALVMLGVDCLGELDDYLGAAARDAMLSSVSALLSETLRCSDIASRFSCDEFALILPDTGKTEAWVVAEKLQAALRGLLAEIGDETTVPVTASMGVASFGESVDSAAGLLEAAASALLVASRGGRGRVELAAG